MSAEKTSLFEIGEKVYYYPRYLRTNNKYTLEQLLQKKLVERGVVSSIRGRHIFVRYYNPITGLLGETGQSTDVEDLIQDLIVEYGLI